MNIKLSRQSRYRRPGRLLALLGVASVIAGCGPTRGTPSPFEGGGPASSGAEDPIRIEVQNLNFNDVTIFAMRQSQRVRLGRVTGKTDETFNISWNVAIPIYFVVDVTGGRSCRTGQIGVDVNARVWVSIPSNVGTQPCRAGRR